MMFRLQLSGEIKMWLNQAEAAGEAWVSDIEEIIVGLERRFETADGKEQVIRRLEEAQQQPDEALSSYLFRLRQTMLLQRKCQKRIGLECCGDLLRE